MALLASQRPPFQPCERRQKSLLRGSIISLIHAGPLRQLCRVKSCFLILWTVLSTILLLHAADPAAEKAFVEKFKTAYEGKDTKTLESFLYKQGAVPMALEFYKMRLTEGAGGKIASIELTDLSPEDQKKVEGVQEGPGGQKTRMPIKPTKKLHVKIDTTDGSGSGSATSSMFVAEKDGKFVIPVPVPAK